MGWFITLVYDRLVPSIPDLFMPVFDPPDLCQGLLFPVLDLRGGRFMRQGFEDLYD